MKHRRGRGEGNIYQRRDGLWTARLQVNGKRQAVSGRSKAAVNEALLNLRTDVVNGAPVIVEKSSVAQYLWRWLKDYVGPTCRPATYRIYEGVIRIHISPCIGDLKLRRLRDLDVQAMLSQLQRAGKGARIRQIAYGVLLKALRQAARSKLIRHNPCELVDKPRKSTPVVRILREQEASHFLRATQRDRLWPLYALALSTGLREGELLALWWKDVNFDERHLSVTHTLTRDQNGNLVRTEPKTASSRRLIHLPQLGVDALKAQQAILFSDGLRDESRYPWVFADKSGSPLLKDVLLRRFKRHLALAGLGPMTFHGLRHTAASLRIAQGAHPKVVQEMLGHSSISTTLDTYGHIMPSLQRESADRFDELFSRDAMAH